MAGHDHIPISGYGLDVFAIELIVLLIKPSACTETMLCIHGWSPEFNFIIYDPMNSPHGLLWISSPDMHTVGQFQQVGQPITTDPAGKKDPNLFHGWDNTRQNSGWVLL
jgi:hypothetical protein